MWRVSGKTLKGKLAALLGHLASLPGNFVTIKEFRPDIQDPSPTDGVFFELMPSETLANYPIDYRILDPGVDRFTDFRPNPNPTTALERIGLNPRHRAIAVHRYFDTRYFNMPRKHLGGHAQTLEEISSWQGMGYDNSFWANVGLMFHSYPHRQADWSTAGVYPQSPFNRLVYR